VRVNNEPPHLNPLPPNPLLIFLSLRERRQVREIVGGEEK